MTDPQKPAIHSAQEPAPETPEGQLNARIELLQAQRDLEAEKRRSAELELRLKNAGATDDKKPAAAPPAAPTEKLNLGNSFEFGKALKMTLLLGAAGFVGYTAKSLFSPAAKLFMAGPQMLRKSKGTVAALGLAGAQALGLGYGGVAAYDYTVDKTSLSTSNVTMAARFGLAGFIGNQFIKSSADAKEPYYNRQSYFDMFVNNTLNGASEVGGKAIGELAKLDEGSGTGSVHVPATAPEHTPAVSLRNKFVQICTPRVNDDHGNFSPDAQRAIENGEMSVHFQKVNALADTMKADQKSTVNTILHKDRMSVRLTVSPYTKANKTIDATAVYADDTVNCPAGHIRARYDAAEWLSAPGLRPHKIEPK